MLQMPDQWQSYRASTLVVYNSRVVTISNLLVIMTPES